MPAHVKPPRSASAREGWPERLALYLAAMHPEALQRLLPGLTPRVEVRTRAHARAVLRLQSADRHALLGREFGPRQDGLERVRALIISSPPALRVALVGQLPTAWRPAFPHLTGPGQPATPPILAALAARLVREAVREEAREQASCR